MMKRTYLVLLTTLLGLALVSCQQAVVDDASDASSEGKMTVNLNVVQFEQVPFSQAAAPQSSRATNIDSIVTKLCFAVYSSASDTHPKTIIQQKGDSDFGKATFKLDKGTYYLVVLAHKSTIDPDMSNINVIDFKQYVTDTFYAYDTLTIDQSLNKELKLRRAVARFELSTTDNIPDSCTRLQLVLSNVCTAFNPVTGYGTAPAEKMTSLSRSTPTRSRPSPAHSPTCLSGATRSRATSAASSPSNSSPSPCSPTMNGMSTR